MATGRGVGAGRASGMVSVSTSGRIGAGRGSAPPIELGWGASVRRGGANSGSSGSWANVLAAGSLRRTSVVLSAAAVPKGSSSAADSVLIRPARAASVPPVVRNRPDHRPQYSSAVAALARIEPLAGNRIRGRRVSPGGRLPSQSLALGRRRDRTRTLRRRGGSAGQGLLAWAGWRTLVRRRSPARRRLVWPRTAFRPPEIAVRSGWPGLRPGRIRSRQAVPAGRKRRHW